MGRFTGIIGLFVLFGIAYGCSKHRKAINWRAVIGGFALQLLLALFILKTPWGQSFFQAMNGVVDAILKCSDEGAAFVFGNLVTPPEGSGIGHIFAVRVLPTIIFVSAVMSILYYLGIMQKIITWIAKLMQKTMRTSGAESMSAAANIFVGQTEAPLVVKPYIEKMTQSEILAIMTGGMATVSGGILAGYVTMLRDAVPGIAGHLIAASIMAAPVGLAMSKILLPETEESLTQGDVKLNIPITDANVIDAAANGATTGMQLVINVAASLIGFIALIALVNLGLGLIHKGLTLDQILGYIFYPIAWVMGVPTQDCLNVASLMGQKTAINEFVAYSHLAALPEMSYRAKVIATYALCGFANLGSIAIEIGGIGAMAPSRRGDLARLGLWALLAASLASFFSATVAGLLTGDPVSTAAVAETVAETATEAAQAAAAVMP